MTRIIGFLLLIAFIFNSSPAKAESVVDQACLIEDASDAFGIDLTDHSAYQLFSPTKDTLDSVVLGLATTSNDITAKVKVKIYRVQDEIGHPDGSVVAEKYVYAQGEGYVKADFADFPLEDGIYSISAEAVHSNQKVYWVATTGTCYPGGYALVGDETRVDLDYFFSVYAYNSIPVASEENDADSSNTGTSASNINSNNSSGSSLPNLPSGAKEIKTSNFSGDAPTNNLSTNTVSASSKDLMSDEELRQQIAGILKDIEENKNTSGAFGLSGVIGRILTWPVFYCICVLVLFSIFLIIVYSKKKKVV